MSAGHPINPYVAGAPLRGQRGFFGRQDTLEWVARELRNPATNALVLFGQRRIGKTSLLLRLQHTLPADEFFPIYFDLQDQAIRPLGQVLADLADTASERAGLAPISPQIFDDHGQFFRGAFLPQLYEQLGSRRLVFLLDEFDALDQTAEESLPERAAAKALIPFLRRVMNEEPQPAFVFAVGRRAEDLSLDWMATFKASLVREVWVLDRISAEAMVRQAEDNHTLCFSDRAVARILEITHCHPYLTQLLCQRIWERAYAGNPLLPPVIDLPDLEGAVADTLQVGNQALLWLWSGMGPAERIYASAFAGTSEEGQVISEDRVMQVLAAHASRLRTREVELAPRDLVKRRVLEAVGPREYRFAIELFRRWVRLNKPLSDVKEELDRIEPLADRFYQLGQELFEQRWWERAARYFVDALEVNPRHFCARLNLGESLLELGRYDAAVAELEQAYALDQDEARLALVRALMAQARWRDQTGDEDGALAACERALHVMPGEPEAQALYMALWRRRAEQACQRQDWQAARAAYQAVGDMDEVARVEQRMQQGLDRRESELAQALPEELLQAYYLALANECRRLSFEAIDPTFAQTLNEQVVSLPDLYIDLDAIPLDEEEEQSERTWAMRLAQGRGRGRTSLLHILARRKSARLIVLGPPGSGKTCFAHHLTFLMATHSAELPKSLHDRLVIRLVLRQVAARHVPPDARGAATMLWEAVRDDIADRLGRSAAEGLLPHLQSRLLKEGGLLIFDGLDQVPQSLRRRQAVLEAIQDLVASLPKNNSYVVVTARPRAYANEELRLPGYTVLGLAPFDREQVDRFLTHWHQVMRSMLGWDEAVARDKLSRLQLALKQWPRLADLASRPLLLALMATMHASRGQLPEERTELCEEIVQLLMWRWQRTTEALGSDGMPLIDPAIARAQAIGQDRWRTFVEPLALAAHQRQQDEWGRDESPADISASEIAIVSKTLPDQSDVGAILEYLLHRAGLWVDRGEGVYAFSHHAFQEYLAACHLVRQPNPTQELRRWIYDDPRWWRQVALFAIGIAKRSELPAAVRMLDDWLAEYPGETTDISETHWRVAAMVGQALIDLCLTEGSEAQTRFAALVERARRWLVRLIESGQLDPHERAEAGDRLGQLGDPRFDASFFFLPRLYRGEPESFFGFVEIRAGPFVMGSQPSDRKVPENEFGNPLQLEIPYPYWIARYPVTVAQFRVFVQDHGYDEPIWWTEAGWAWRTGQRAVPASEDKSRPLELRGAPWGWDEQCRYPNRPVGGLTWFEAMAYGKWLDAQWRVRSPGDLPRKYLLRLPTEAEWEKAARSGDARLYPWGDSSGDEDQASLPGQIGHTTTVGMYPRGSSPLGLCDMSGNVWEWTLSLYQPYPYDPLDGRNQRDAQGERGIRGGTWTGLRRVARCAYRRSSSPDTRDDRMGFRIVIAPARGAF